MRPAFGEHTLAGFVEELVEALRGERRGLEAVGRVLDALLLGALKAEGLGYDERLGVRLHALGEDDAEVGGTLVDDEKRTCSSHNECIDISVIASPGVRGRLRET